MSNKEECCVCETFDFLKSIQKPRVEKGEKITYRYTFAIVDECCVNGKSRGRSTHYTWKRIKYCPLCGKKYNRRSDVKEFEE